MGTKGGRKINKNTDSSRGGPENFTKTQILAPPWKNPVSAPEGHVFKPCNSLDEDTKIYNRIVYLLNIYVKYGVAVRTNYFQINIFKSTICTAWNCMLCTVYRSILVKK